MTDLPRPATLGAFGEVTGARTVLIERPGNDIYLVGGACTTAGLIDAGPVDELHLLVYPLIAGEGTALFATTQRRSTLQLREATALADGRVRLAYTLG